MRKANLYLSLVTLGMGQIVMAQNTTPSNPSNGTDKPPEAAPKKLQAVHAIKATGFDLSPVPSNRETEIAGASRGTGTETTLLAPNKGVTYTLSPLFQWMNGSKDPITYKFRLLASDRQSVLFETEVTGTQLKYPASAPSLVAGGDYFWTVEPAVSFLGEGPALAELLVLGGSQRSTLERRLTSISDERAKARMFAEMKVWYDAVETYTHLLEENPNARDIRLERAEIYNQMPQTKAAASKDIAQADEIGSNSARP